jgi:surface antigen
MRLLPIIAVAMLPALLPACGPGNKQGTGTILGATGGAIAGAAIGGRGSGRIVGAGVGAVVGGILGNEIGRSMDDRDRQMAAEAEFRALEYGQPGTATAWNNPQSQHRGQIVPGKPYQQGGTHCRPYTHTIYVSGQPQTVRGTACRNPDGTWQAVS